MTDVFYKFVWKFTEKSLYFLKDRKGIRNIKIYYVIFYLFIYCLPLDNLNFRDYAEMIKI